MNPIAAAVAALVQAAFEAVLPVLVNWFRNHVLPHNQTFQAMPKEELRSQARQWVKDLLAEFGGALVAKKLVPGWVTPFLPLIEAGVEVAIESALDASGF